MQEVNYIGIGASAGGLNALQTLLSYIPLPSHSIFIIAQHFSPDKKSILSEILARTTEMDVIEAKEGVKFLVGKVYIVDPNLTLAKDENANLFVIPSKNRLAPQPSIDDIFTFLANFNPTRTIGILLSGSGHDGVKGLRAISEAGGVTLVQSPQEAEFHSMPQSALDAKVVNVELKLQDIAIVITELDSVSDDETALRAIGILLLNYNGFDINKYKEKTILRRMYKRMLLLQVDTLKSYIRYTIQNPQELQLLYENILIGVTSFFRDKEAFDILGEYLEEMLEKAEDKKEFRIWVTACSTGEEAYSIAIVLEELMQKRNETLPFSIFASDIDDISLEKARQGIYSVSDLENVEPKLVEKYFFQKADTFEVSQILREKIVFTHHDLLNEPPFIKMDLITCRNALIYFTHSIQKEVFTLFHYALNPHGILFLGISEALPQSMNYFTLLNSKWKIYVKELSMKPPKLAPRFYKMLSLSETAENRIKNLKKEGGSDIETFLSQSIYELFISSSVIINRHNDIIYTKGKIPYLEFSDGFASLNVFKNLHKHLQLELRYTLDKSRKKDKKVVTKFVELKNSVGESVFVRIAVIPFSYQANEGLSVLNFQEYKIDEMIFDIAEGSVASESDVVKSLQSQVSQMKAQMHILQNELDSSNENMQMINEELQSSNEELQSSNEELETSNEELQASNEELNETYQHIDILQQQYSTILESTMDGIVGLDLEEKHTFINSAALEMFGATKEELEGKKGHGIWHHTKADGTPFSADECPILNVIKTGESIRGEDLYWRKDGSSFAVEYTCSPLIENSKISGAVLSFHDISEKKALEQSIAHEQFLLKHYFDSTQALIVVLNKEGNIELLNQKGADLLVTDINTVVGKNWFKNFIDASIREKTSQLFKTIIESDIDSITPYTNEVITTQGKKCLIYWTNTPLVDENNKINGVIATGIDITQENELRTRLHEEEQKYSVTFNKASIGIKITALDGRFLDVNSWACDILGYTKEEFVSMRFQDITYAQDLKIEKQYMHELLNDTISFYEMQKRLIGKNANDVWVNISTSLVKDKNNNPKYFVSVLQDMTQVKALSVKVHEQEEMMIAQSRQAAMGDMIAMIAHQWRQPISVISMEINNLEADLELQNDIDKENLSHLIKTISLQTQHLSQTIEDFKDFFKPNKEREVVSLEEIFANVRTLLLKSLQNNNISFTVTMQENYQITVYKNELIQVLVNIIINAKDAIIDKDIKDGEVTVDVSIDKTKLSIKICDNGSGIPEDLLDKIGEPYVSSKGKNGTGLGLYISRVIVQKHLKGRLTWESSDAGACFLIALPNKEIDYE